MGPHAVCGPQVSDKVLGSGHRRWSIKQTSHLQLPLVSRMHGVLPPYNLYTLTVQCLSTGLAYLGTFLYGDPLWDILSKSVAECWSRMNWNYISETVRCKTSMNERSKEICSVVAENGQTDRQTQPLLLELYVFKEHITRVNVTCTYQCVSAGRSGTCNSSVDWRCQQSGPNIIITLRYEESYILLVISVYQLYCQLIIIIFIWVHLCKGLRSLPLVVCYTVLTSTYMQ